MTEEQDLIPVRTVAPTAEAITVAEVKAFIRSAEDDDDLVEFLIEAATAHLDGRHGILGRALLTQTWRQDFAAFDEPLRLSIWPAASITSITYFDGDNASQTLASSVYGLFSDSIGPFVGLKPSQTWPTTYSRRDAVSVTYVCGEATAPAQLKAAIMIIVARWYEHREEVGDSSAIKALDGLIASYRKVLT
jgi:uncharacterized phiE125 gp8 family phage protein